MDSVFCFEIAIDVVKLYQCVDSSNPFVVCSFLDFPSIVIYAEKPFDKSTNNIFQFFRGKSCLFKNSPTILFQQLAITPIYLIVLDKATSEPSVIGSCSIDLSSSAKQILNDIQTNGLHSISCHGSCLRVQLLNSLQSAVGLLEVAYKLTSFGHSMLPHLAGTKKENLTWWPTVKKVESRDQQLSPIEHILLPPPLFYNSKSDTRKETELDKAEIFANKSVTSGSEASKSKVLLKKSPILSKRFHLTSLPQSGTNQHFISVQTSEEQTNETTQTDDNFCLKHLENYPIIKGLIKEVFSLGLNGQNFPNYPSKQSKASKSSNEPTRKMINKSIQKSSCNNSINIHFKKSSSSVQPSKTLDSVFKLNQCHDKENSMKKSQITSKPLRFGLTRSLKLRTEWNKLQIEKNINQLKSFKNKKIIKQNISKRKRSSPESLNIFPDKHISYVEMYKDDSSCESTFHESPVLQVKDLVAIQSDSTTAKNGIMESSTLNRQSIEIHLPNATIVEFNNPGRNTSDEFDESESLSNKISKQLSIHYAESLFSSSLSESNEYFSKFSKNVTTLSAETSNNDLSQSQNRCKHKSDDSVEEKELKNQENDADYLDKFPTKLKNNLAEVPNQSLTVEDSLDIIKHEKIASLDSSISTLANPSPSVIYPLPVPEPSHSPIIRSLASESGGLLKPSPPQYSKPSKNHENYRNFRRSFESSCQYSNLSDVHSSDIADIKTSDISDFKSSDDVGNSLKKKMSFSTLASLSEI